MIVDGGTAARTTMASPREISKSDYQIFQKHMDKSHGFQSQLRLSFLDIREQMEFYVTSPMKTHRGNTSRLASNPTSLFRVKHQWPTVNLGRESYYITFSLTTYRDNLYLTRAFLTYACPFVFDDSSIRKSSSIHFRMIGPVAGSPMCIAFDMKLQQIVRIFSHKKAL